MNIGDKIPLQSQTGNYTNSDFCRAVVRDALGDAISGSPFTLTPDATGFYTNRTALMPDTPSVSVDIKFYQDSGFTELSTMNGGTDYFVELSTGGGGGGSTFVPTNMVGVIDGDECSNSPIEDTVVVGSDRTLSIRLQDVLGNPFDLTTLTEIQCRFLNADGTILVVSLDDVSTPITVTNAGGGQFTLNLTKVQTALLSTQTPAPFTVIVTTEFGVTVVNFPTQLSVEDASV